MEGDNISQNSEPKTQNSNIGNNNNSSTMHNAPSTKPKKKVYSHSKLQSFEQCPYRYKLRYIDKVPSPIEKTVEAHLGTCTHDSLEWLYNEVIVGKLPSLDDVLEKYLILWTEGDSDGIIVVKKNFTKDDYKLKGIQFITDYYMKHKPFKDGTLEMEKQVWINFSDEHSAIGYIDRLVHNKETGEYEVHDYKTANSMPSQQKLDEDRQLALYSIAIKNLFGQDKKVLLTWHYLAHNKQVYSRRTDEQLKQLQLDIVELIQEIESATEFPVKTSVLCGWCEYKTYCKAHGNQLPEKYRQKQTTLDLSKPGVGSLWSPKNPQTSNSTTH
jgi:putative RecB family exonuclease